MSTFSDLFERVYIINLPYKKDRRLRLEAHLKQQGLAESGEVNWVTAISGDWCRPPEYFKAGGGAWGCLQSHTQIVQNAIMDGLENFLVLEDDVVFAEGTAAKLAKLMKTMPRDWGQFYLGGQHLRKPDPVAGRTDLLHCRNVNRTHAFALHKRAMVEYQQHICHAPDYIAHGAWHVDHQLGLAHERGGWKVYGPKWWLAGQEAGPSNISGQINPRMWWHYSGFGATLPFVHVTREDQETLSEELRPSLHFGNHLKEGTLEDIGLDRCVDSDTELKKWLDMIAREAVDRALLPAIQHPGIPHARVARCWAAGVRSGQDEGIGELVDYAVRDVLADPSEFGSQAARNVTGKISAA